MSALEAAKEVVGPKELEFFKVYQSHDLTNDLTNDLINDLTAWADMQASNFLRYSLTVGSGIAVTGCVTDG